MAKSNGRSGSKSRSGSSSSSASARGGSRAGSKGRSSSSASSRSSKTGAAARGGSSRAKGRSSSAGRASSSSSKTNPNARSGSRAGSARTPGKSGKSGGGSSRSRASSQATTDHEQIRQWAEARGGKPACVRGTGGGGDTGMLRLDFPGYSGADSLQEISWDEWFEQFDDQGLALLYQEKTKDGQQSNFNKLVSRATAAKSGGGKASRSRGAK